MGITGLIPFMENASNRTNIKDFKGSVVCVDAYCWLHKGIYACSDILAMGGTSDLHIKYCLKFVKMLLHHNIKPILVFDGQHLPAKELTEKKRRETRKQAKVRAAELLKLGKKSEARKYFNKCVDVSHKMALELMHECRKLDVDCIVAPYEADSQLAFLNISGIADYVITEDSDLVLFGCKKILFKLELSGSCVEVDCNKLHLAMECSLEKYSLQKFRYMAILSGCDYLDSLPGIGLAKACKFILKTEEENMNKALDKIPAYLNMRHLEVTPEYKLNFLRANATFMHMFVYDPRIRKLVRLSEPSEHNTDIELCCNAGSMLDDKTAFQLAIGNLDPHTLQKMDNWSPQTKTKSKALNKVVPSIWRISNDSQYLRSSENESQYSTGTFNRKEKSIDEIDRLTYSKKEPTKRTKGNQDNLLSTYTYKQLPTPTEESQEEKLAREDALLSSYTEQSPPPKKLKSCIDDDVTSPSKVPTRNPFCLPKNNTGDSTNLRALTKTLSPVKKPISISEKRKLVAAPLVISRFFCKPKVKAEKPVDDVENSSQKEIQEKFLQVQSLYNDSLNDALSLYGDVAGDQESKTNPNQNKCKNNSEDKNIEIIEVKSDSEEDQKTTVNKPLDKFLNPKNKPKFRVSGLRKPKAAKPANQPSLAQFMFTKTIVK